MKKSILVIGIICITIMVICFLNFNFSQNNDSTNIIYAKPIEQQGFNQKIPIPTDYKEEFYINQAESVELFNQILSEFERQNNKSVCSMNENPDIGNRYPDYYGGAYINQNTGSLVLLVKDDETNVDSIQKKLYSQIDRIIAEEEKKQVSKNCTPSYKLEKCDVSLNEMYETIGFLLEHREELLEQGVELTMLSDDILNQKVLISIRNLTSEKETIVQSYIPECNYLSFQDSAYFLSEASVAAGDQIGNPATGYSATLGFAAKKHNAYGYVISGHINNPEKPVGEKIKYNGTTIGTVLESAWHDGTSADAAFVSATKGSVLSNYVANGGSIITGDTSILPIGTVIYMYGYKSKLQAGKITAFSITIPSTKYYRYTLFDQVGASYFSQNGDSGAPILLYKGSNYNLPKYALCGIHVGTDPSNPDRRVFSAYKQIKKALNLSCITEVIYK